MSEKDTREITKKDWKELLNTVYNQILLSAVIIPKQIYSALDFINSNITVLTSKNLNLYMDYYNKIRSCSLLLEIRRNEDSKNIKIISDLIRQISDYILELEKSIKKNSGVTIHYPIVDKDDLNAKEIDLLKAKFSVELSSIKDEIQELKNINFHKQSSEIKSVLNKVKKQKTEIDSIVGTISENANAGRYIQYSERNRKSARWLFWSSIIIMFLIAGFSIYHLWNLNNIDNAKILLRLSLGVFILLPALFMMRESKKLKDKEFQFKDMECRIMTSGVFIDSLDLDKSEKDKLKVSLIRDFFSIPIECRDDGGLPPIENICEIIKACITKEKNDK